jgi:glutaminase
MNDQPATNYQHALSQVYAAIKPLIGEGVVASYIPELAKVLPNQFGMAICDLQGNIFEIGDANTPFSIQSISKLFSLTQAIRYQGEALWDRVGREPSGNPFNSLVQLESEKGKPRNPFINAGALVITDVLLDHSEAGAGQTGKRPDAVTPLLTLLQRVSGNPDIGFDKKVANSERGTANRNTAMAYFMKGFGNLHQDIDLVLDTYCTHCAIEMSCIDLARAMGFLANSGVIPNTTDTIIDKSAAKRINALMLTCGTYDAAGDFAYRVGLPAKSGVGGGIVAVVPGECSICVWSPALEPSGNSHAGSVALEVFTSITGKSIF